MSGELPPYWTARHGHTSVFTSVLERRHGAGMFRYSRRVSRTGGHLKRLGSKKRCSRGILGRKRNRYLIKTDALRVFSRRRARDATRQEGGGGREGRGGRGERGEWKEARRRARTTKKGKIDASVRQRQVKKRQKRDQTVWGQRRRKPLRPAPCCT